MVQCVMRLVWECLNGRLYIFVTFESDVSGNKYIQCWWVSSQDGDVNKFCEFLFSDQGCLGKMMSAKVVVEVNLEVTAKIIYLKLKVLLEELVVFV